MSVNGDYRWCKQELYEYCSTVCYYLDAYESEEPGQHKRRLKFLLQLSNSNYCSSSGVANNTKSGSSSLWHPGFAMVRQRDRAGGGGGWHFESHFG
jgi:hypothetical protein